MSYFLVQPKRQPIKFVNIYFPPATGEVQALIEEAEGQKDIGGLGFIIQPSYLKKNLKAEINNIKFPELEIEKIRRNLSDVAIQVEKIIKDFKGFPIVFSGKNLGGTYAAYVAKSTKIQALTTFGSIPVLSRFWLQSEHPCATIFRRDKSQEDILNFSNQVEKYDLLSSIKTLGVNSLIQIGGNDEWIDEDQRNLIGAVKKSHIRVSWSMDGHDMNNLANVLERKNFIRDLI